jgi:NhaP-type Na+/H+ and K+/H+ antiporter
MFKEKDNGNLDTLFVKLKIIEKDIEWFKQFIIDPSRRYEGFTLK